MFLCLILVALTFLRGGGAEAASKYKIRINKQQNCVTIYEVKANGKYKPIKAFVCSVGYDTPLGTFGLKEKIRWHELDGPVYGQYCTRITGHILFHSVWYHVNENPATLSNTQYNRLGSTASHGCVRLNVRDSKWIYDNVPFGTPVTIYNGGMPGPLGKPKAIKLPAGTGWDPTDVTNPKNPYNKKKPILKVTGGKVTYASRFDLLDGVVAKNTTGFDAKDLVTYTIRYQVKGSQSYKKVKSINTRKPGTYRVTYKLTDEINRTVKRTVVYRVLTQVAIQQIQLNQDDKTLYLGGEPEEKNYRLKVKKVLPKEASIKDVQFSSSNPEVVTVKPNGTVTARGVGTAEVVALAADGSGQRAVCQFTVKRYVGDLSLTAGTSQIGVGQILKLTSNVSPKTASNQKLEYSSSDSTVASVDAAGVVTGRKQGSVTITATTTDGTNKRATIGITVVNMYASMATNHMGEVTLPVSMSLDAAISALPSTVLVTDVGGSQGSATIAWTIAGYNPALAGSYAAEGTLTLPAGWIGSPEKVQATVTLIPVEPVTSEVPAE